MSLPVVHAGDGPAVADPETGALIPLKEASPRLLLDAVAYLDALRSEVTAARYALGAELKDRYSIGTSHDAGYSFKVQETVSWPLGETQRVLRKLYEDHVISRADMDRALPLKPKPDAVQLKALLGRLATRDAKAWRMLADCASISAASVRDVREEAVRGEAIES